MKSLSALTLSGGLVLLGSVWTTPALANSFTAKYQGGFSLDVTVDPTGAVSTFLPGLPSYLSLDATNLKGSFLIDPDFLADGDLTISDEELKQLLATLPTYIPSEFAPDLESALALLKDIYDDLDYSLTGTATVTPDGSDPFTIDLTYDTGFKATFDQTKAAACLPVNCNFLGNADFALNFALPNSPLPPLKLLTGKLAFDFDTTHPVVDEDFPSGKYAFNLEKGDFLLKVGTTAGEKEFDYSVKTLLAYTNFDPSEFEPKPYPDDKDPVQSVPEPGIIAGLLTVGALATRRKFRPAQA